MSVVADERLRIGEVAELTGTTTRTIRYYEEIGLLRGGERAQGKHRFYTQTDADRIHEIVRLRNLLGVSLEQLSSHSRLRLHELLSSVASTARPRILPAQREILGQLLGLSALSSSSCEVGWPNCGTAGRRARAKAAPGTVACARAEPGLIA